MRFRNLDVNGDWTFGKGRQNYLIESDALLLDIKTRLDSFLNDCFFATTDGVDWFNLLGAKNRDGIIAAIRKTLIETENVTKINDVDIYFDSSTRKTVLTFNIDSAFTENMNASQEILS